MAKVPINDPNYWRERAEETRAIAADIRDPVAHKMMQKIAKDYEELARRAECRLKKST